MKDKLLENLYPLYGDLLDNVSLIKEDLWPFCIQWGNNFPESKNAGILFVGKANNGWVTKERNLSILFGESDDSIFARPDQMTWVADLGKSNKTYNTNKSAFWRIISSTSKKILGKDQWHSDVAWSNLYKINPHKGNPNAKLKKYQLETCKRILKSEIDVLSPKFVIFLTSGWENDFLPYLGVNLNDASIKYLKWDRYKTKYVSKDGITYILSHHPQGKNEKDHIKVLTQIIESRNSA